MGFPYDKQRSVTKITVLCNSVGCCAYVLDVIHNGSLRFICNTTLELQSDFMKILVVKPYSVVLQAENVHPANSIK